MDYLRLKLYEIRNLEMAAQDSTTAPLAARSCLASGLALSSTADPMRI
ncbi:hypothetical protein GLA29479_407 [Lysobacter antibioticus]|nr:hypothetical protein GLA29479_407 [Lysobacter antibioticus]